MFNNNSTRNNKSSTQSSASSALASQPQSVFYPISLPFYNYLPTQASPLASQLLLMINQFQLFKNFWRI